MSLLHATRLKLDHGTGEPTSLAVNNINALISYSNTINSIYFAVSIYILASLATISDLDLLLENDLELPILLVPVPTKSFALYSALILFVLFLYSLHLLRLQALVVGNLKPPLPSRHQNSRNTSDIPQHLVLNPASPITAQLIPGDQSKTTKIIAKLQLLTLVASTPTIYFALLAQYLPYGQIRINAFLCGTLIFSLYLSDRIIIRHQLGNPLLLLCRISLATLALIFIILSFFAYGNCGVSSFFKNRLVVRDAVLKDSIFKNRSLLCADFTGTDFTRTDFSGSDLTGAVFNSTTLQDVYFFRVHNPAPDSSTTTSDNTSEQKLHELHRRYRFSLSEQPSRPTQLSKASFRHADLSGANLSYSNLTGADISFADLDNSIIFGSTLQDVTAFQAMFRNSRIAAVDISNSNFTQSDFSNAILHGGSYPQGPGAGASFYGARFENTILSGWLLQGAIFVGAQLIDTNFVNSDLTGADFRAANLKAPQNFKVRIADFQDATADCICISHITLQEPWVNSSNPGHVQVNLSRIMKPAPKSEQGNPWLAHEIAECSTTETDRGSCLRIELPAGLAPLQDALDSGTLSATFPDLRLSAPAKRFFWSSYVRTILSSIPYDGQRESHLRLISLLRSGYGLYSIQGILHISPQGYPNLDLLRALDLPPQQTDDYPNGFRSLVLPLCSQPGFSVSELCRYQLSERCIHQAVLASLREFCGDERIQ